jgi:hypothetical protein
MLNRRQVVSMNSRSSKPNCEQREETSVMCDFKIERRDLSDGHGPWNGPDT